MNVGKVKEAVRERDGMRCTKCGMTNASHLAHYGRALEVHRLVPGSLYTLEGCVTLCRSCHGPEPKRRRGTVDLNAPEKADTVSIRLPKRLVLMARVVALETEIEWLPYIEQLLRHGGRGIEAEFREQAEKRLSRREAVTP